MKHVSPCIPCVTARSLGWLALSVAISATAFAQYPVNPPDGIYEFTSVTSGNWHNPTTWGATSLIPDDGDDILIQAGHVVTIRRQEDKRHRYIRVEGQLRMGIQADTRLYVESIFTVGTTGGSFVIGAPQHPVLEGATAEVVFTSSGPLDLTWDPSQIIRGLNANGPVRLFGQPRTHRVAIEEDLLAGATQLTLASPPADWRAGEEIVIAGTVFRRIAAPEPTPCTPDLVTSSQDERVVIQSIAGGVVSFLPALAYDHVRVDGHPFHAAHLTRNIILRSEDTTETWDRGHVILQNGDVWLDHVAFVDLGRTDKRIPLDDRVIETLDEDSDGQEDDNYNIIKPPDAEVTNPRGRYPVHFHLNGIQPQAAEPPSKVYGCVVDDTPGWAYASHQSHVDFQRNVAYDFAGAGFVTETGDELGNFFDNIAIRGTGSCFDPDDPDEDDYRQTRLVYANANRPQPLGDFAFSGDGFWFQGPAIRVKNNVANGCDGAGMIWFTTGAPRLGPNNEFVEDGQTHNRYSHFPRSALEDVYGPDSGLEPRYWDHSETDEKLVISDLPILEFRNFVAYGNFIGFRLRFNNHNNRSFYGEPPFFYTDHIVCSTEPCSVERNRQVLDQLTLWNNEQAFRMRYTSNNDWSRVEAINRLAYEYLHPYDGHAGTEMRSAILSQTFTDLTIDGYPVAGWTYWFPEDAGPEEVEFLDPPDYVNFANFDVWSREYCERPRLSPVTDVTSSSATVSWQEPVDGNGGPVYERYLLRYQPQGAQQWQFVQLAEPPAELSGLASGTTYDVHLLAGCLLGDESTLTTWSPRVSFTTD